MILYCNINPGLLVLKELQPHQLGEAKQILESLSVHRKNIVDHNMQIPVTDPYLVHIMESLSLIKISDPPIERPLKGLLFELLGRTVFPGLPPTDITDVITVPDIFPGWISEETKQLWLDCLVSAILRKISDGSLEEAQLCNVIATLNSEKHGTTKIVSQEVNTKLGINQEFSLPTIAKSVEWAGYISHLEPWPHGIDSSRIELFAFHYLNIPLEAISNHRQIYFEPACIHDISREEDGDLRAAIIEVLACRAYNLLRPEHDDHNVVNQPGIRRLYVKKMAPAVRLHYIFDGNDVVFNLYSNGKHNKGLK